MRPTRLLPALAGLVLALATLVPAHAAGTGTLTVTMVDERGEPMPGQIMVLDGTGLGAEQRGAVSTATFDLPPGAYGVMALSTWSGMLCAGMQQCSYVAAAGGPAGIDGTVTVVDGETTEVLLEAEEPVTLPGRATVGRPLAVRWSGGMSDLIDYFTMAGGGLYNPTVQWLRDGRPITDAIGMSYRPGAGDAGRSLSVRVDYPALAAVQFQTITGQRVTPRTSNRVRVSKVATKAFANLAFPTVPAGRQGRVRVDVTAPGTIVTGQVRVRVGTWTTTLRLRNGTARTPLPRLPAGRHPVRAAYLGSGTFESSTAKPVVLTVG